MWMRFYKYAKQYITPALIGAFRMRDGQISNMHYESYLKECDQIIDAHVKDLSPEDRRMLNKISKAKRHSMFNKIFRKLGLKDVGLPITLPNEVVYDRHSKIFRKTTAS